MYILVMGSLSSVYGTTVRGCGLVGYNLSATSNKFNLKFTTCILSLIYIYEKKQVVLLLMRVSWRYRRNCLVYIFN